MASFPYNMLEEMPQIVTSFPYNMLRRKCHIANCCGSKGGLDGELRALFGSISIEK